MSSKQGGEEEEKPLKQPKADKKEYDEGIQKSRTNPDEEELFQKMLEMRKSCSLKPSRQKLLALASQVKILQKEGERLRNNLTTVEQEVELLFKKHNISYEENSSPNMKIDKANIQKQEEEEIALKELRAKAQKGALGGNDN